MGVMVEDEDVATANRRLADLQTRTPAAIAQWADLGGDYLDVSRGFQRGDDTDAAFHAAQEGIRRLGPAFLKNPEALAEPMRGLVAQYLTLTQHGARKADEALLMPIAMALGQLIDPDADD